MKILPLLVPLMLATAVVARAAEPKVITLWPEGVPGLKADVAEERIVDGRVVGIHYPSLTLYAPEASRVNGTAVIYCPGGGYVRLSIGENGGADTKWLNGLGVTAFVLKHHLVEYGHPAPLRDVLRSPLGIRQAHGRTSAGRAPDRHPDGMLVTLGVIAESE
jgi:acetyl esterase/lipase